MTTAIPPIVIRGIAGIARGVVAGPSTCRVSLASCTPWSAGQRLEKEAAGRGAGGGRAAEEEEAA